MALNFITKDEFKEYAGVEHQTDDALIENIIKRMTAVIKTYCNNDFVAYMNESKTTWINLPEDIKDACIQLVLLRYSTDTRLKMGKNGESLGSTRMDFSNEMPWDVKIILDNPEYKYLGMI